MLHSMRGCGRGVGRDEFDHALQAAARALDGGVTTSWSSPPPRSPGAQSPRRGRRRARSGGQDRLTPRFGKCAVGLAAGAHGGQGLFAATDPSYALSAVSALSLQEQGGPGVDLPPSLSLSVVADVLAAAVMTTPPRIRPAGRIRRRRGGRGPAGAAAMTLVSRPVSSRHPGRCLQTTWCAPAPTGSWPPCTRVTRSPEREPALRFGWLRETVRQALHELLVEGRIEPTASGTVVWPPPNRAAAVVAVLH